MYLCQPHFGLEYSHYVSPRVPVTNNWYINYAPWKIPLIWIQSYTGKSKRMGKLTHLMHMKNKHYVA